MFRPAEGMPQMSDRGLEEPVADSVEQRQDTVPGSAELDDIEPSDLPFEADEADAAEQARGVDLGEDEYR
jgi:hypothetical protein